MKNTTFIILLFSIFISRAQTKIEGYILDKDTNEPLEYAAIKLINSNYYTITNEDGKFELKVDIKKDSLKIQYLGYHSKKIPSFHFINNSKLYLTSNYEAINEVVIIGNSKKNNSKKNNSKIETYNLLYSLIEKYRNSTEPYKSKAFLSLASSAKGIPIEHIEGFYNSNQNLAKGIIDLEIKNGRFGQNKKFSFFSLDNTTILKDFQFFERSEQMLPKHPGNMSLSSIKSKYKVQLYECESCESGDATITFTTKKDNARFFDGKIIFNTKDQIIKKIELHKTDPKTTGLSSLRKDDVLTPKKIKLNIVFNPNDYTKIQHLDFTFVNKYQSESIYEIITSRSFLYFYDYNNPFTSPYFTNKIAFKNDYDKIVALKSSEKFWSLNYKFPKSYNDIQSINFLKENGYLIHYDNEIKQSFINLIKPAVISWNKKRRLNWYSIKTNTSKKNKIETNRVLKQGEAYNVDESYNTLSELSKSNANHRNDKLEVLNFSYALNPYLSENVNHLTTSTVFDRNSSFYKGFRSHNKLIYINIIFDIYEYYRLNLENQIADNNNLTFEKKKELYTKTFNEASTIIKKMKSETTSGQDFQNLIKWNEKIKNKLNIDNISIISKNN